MNKKPYIFGPILSRRLGLSLGLDIVPYKTCSYDCVYCECGKTNNLSLDYFSYLNVDTVLKKLKEKLKTVSNLDYITFSGSGEPTLNKDFPYYVKTLKKEFNEYKIALLTNTSTINNREVYEASLLVDLYVPSMDAVLLKSFNKINRPHTLFNLEEVKTKLIEFSKEFKKLFYLEVFLAKNINDTEEDIKELANYIKKLKYTKVQINTIDRPGTEANIENIDIKTINLISYYLKNINYEYVSNINNNLNYKKISKNIKQELLNTIKIRAISFKDILNLYNIDEIKAKALLQCLIDDNKIIEVKHNNTLFYKIR